MPERDLQVRRDTDGLRLRSPTITGVNLSSNREPQVDNYDSVEV